LGTLPGDVTTAAVAINNRDQVTGVSADANNNIRGFLWQNGAMYDLNDLVVGNPPLYLLHGFGINDAGWLVGLAFNSDVNEVHGFLAIPVPISAQGGAQQNRHANNFSLPDFSRRQIQQLVHMRYFGEPPDPCKIRCK
jgi:probable HAF family extracellular repeat protein